MPGIGLGGREAALGVDRRDRIERREACVGDACAGLGQHAQCAIESGTDMRVHAVEAEIFRHREAQPCERRRRGHGGRCAGQDRVDDGAAGDAGCQRSDRIQAWRQRQHAVDRHAPRGRLVADDAAERRRDAARPAGVGAQPGRHHAVRHRDRGAGRTAARDARRRAVPRRQRRAVMRIDAEAGEGELGHVGAPHRHEPGGQHSLHHWRIGRGRRRIGQRARPGRRRFAGDVEQVLQATGMPA